MSEGPAVGERARLKADFTDALIRAEAEMRGIPEAEQRGAWMLDPQVGARYEVLAEERLNAGGRELSVADAKELLRPALVERRQAAEAQVERDRRARAFVAMVREDGDWGEHYIDFAAGEVDGVELGAAFAAALDVLVATLKIEGGWRQ